MNKNQILLLILAASQFTHIMDFMIMMPLGPQLMRIFEITPQQFSTLVASYTFSAGIFGFLSAFFIDRFDRKKALVIVYAGFTIGTFACAMAPSYIALMISRIATGAFGGILGALVLSIISDLFAYEKRAKAIGIVMTAFSVASVFGVPFGLYMATIYSWHAPFYILASLGVIICIAMVVFIPPIRNHLVHKNGFKKQMKIVKHFFTSKNILLALLFTIVLMLGQFTVIPFLAPYMVANVGFSELELTYIYIVGGGLTIFTSPYIGKMADKHGKPKVFTIFGVLAIIPLFLITHLPEVPLYLALIVTGAFFIIINGRFVPAITMVTAVVKTHNRGSFMSVRSAVQQFGSSIAAFLAGLIVVENEAGQIVNYQYVGYIAILSSIVAIWVGRKLIAADE